MRISPAAAGMLRVNSRACSRSGNGPRVMLSRCPVFALSRRGGEASNASVTSTPASRASASIFSRTSRGEPEAILNDKLSPSSVRERCGRSASFCPVRGLIWRAKLFAEDSSAKCPTVRLSSSLDLRLPDAPGFSRTALRPTAAWRASRWSSASASVRSKAAIRSRRLIPSSPRCNRGRSRLPISLLERTLATN